MIKRALTLILAVLACASLFSRCAGKTTSESWAYNYEPETTVLELNSDGNGSLKGSTCSYTDDGTFLHLKFTDGNSLDLRYIRQDGKLFIFEKTVYEFQGDGIPSGLEGYWLCPEKKWTFEFTSGGEFLEDGYFPGKYTRDVSESSFTLYYNDEFEDTKCYYSIEDSKLTIEYPWQMVKVEK